MAGRDSLGPFASQGCRHRRLAGNRWSSGGPHTIAPAVSLQSAGETLDATGKKPRRTPAANTLHDGDDEDAHTRAIIPRNSPRPCPRSPFLPPRHPIRVVLSTTALLPLVSLRTAAAPVLAQVGVAAFFVASVASDALGASAGAFVLGAASLAAFARAMDVESWALLLPGGFSGRVGRAFGPRLATAATAIVLLERILLGGLACVVLGHYVAIVTVTALAGLPLTGYVRSEDVATFVAVTTIAVLWFRLRIGRDMNRDTSARAIWLGCLLLVLAVCWAGAPRPRARDPALNIALRRGDLPLGLILPALAAGAGVSAMIVLGDVPSVAALVGVVGLSLALNRKRTDQGISEEQAAFDLLRTTDLSLDHVEARPGNVLVPVRNPHALVQLARRWRRRAAGMSWS